MTYYSIPRDLPGEISFDTPAVRGQEERVSGIHIEGMAELAEQMREAVGDDARERLQRARRAIAERPVVTLFGEPIGAQDIERIPGLAEALQQDQDAVTEILELAARDGNPVIDEYLARHEARAPTVVDPHPDRCWRCDDSPGCDDLEGLCGQCHANLITTSEETRHGRSA